MEQQEKNAAPPAEIAPARPQGPLVEVMVTVRALFQNGDKFESSQPIQYQEPAQLHGFMLSVIQDAKKLGGFLKPFEDGNGFGVEWTPLEALKNITVSAKPVEQPSVVLDTNVNAASILASIRAKRDAAIRGKSNVVDMPSPGSK